MKPIQIELSIDAPKEKILAALITPEGIQGWWSKDSDIGTKVGEMMDMRFDKQGQKVNMSFKIEENGPDQAKWNCTKNDNPVWVGTNIIWDLSGKTVKFSHEGFTQGRPPYDMTAQGWQHFCNSFKSFVETGKGQPW